jgi:hypothetical protein
MRPSGTSFPLSTSALFVSVGLLTLGCAPQPKPARAPAPSAQAALLPDPDPLSDFEPQRYRAFSEVPPAPIQPALDDRTSVACRWVASAWSVPLSITAQTGKFATVSDGRAVQVTIPEGDSAAGASVRFELVGLRLNLLVVAEGLELHLTTPKRFGGYIWSRAQTPLSWVRASHGRVAYELRLPSRVTPVGVPPRGEAACRELVLEGPDDEQELSDALREGRTFVWQARWRGAERVPLSLAAGQPAVAFLDTRAECLLEAEECGDAQPDDVIVFERRGQFLRIAYLLETGVVVGWVPQSALQEPLTRVGSDVFTLPTAPWGGPTDLFGANDPTRPPNGDEKPFCAWNAPLAVEISGATRTAGTVASAIPLLLRARRDGWREVELQHPALFITSGTRFWVPERLLYPCEARQ